MYGGSHAAVYMGETAVICLGGAVCGLHCLPPPSLAASSSPSAAAMALPAHPAQLLRSDRHAHQPQVRTAQWSMGESAVLCLSCSSHLYGRNSGGLYGKASSGLYGRAGSGLYELQLRFAIVWENQQQFAWEGQQCCV